MVYLEKDNSIDNIIKGCQVAPILAKEFISYTKKRKWNPLNLLLAQEFGNKFLREISMLNEISATVMRYNYKGSFISLNKNNYVTANQITKQGISYQRTRDLLTLLDSAGYITLYVGYYSPNEGEGMPSFFIIEDKYLCLWEGVDVSLAAPIQQDVLIVRDSNTKEPLSTRQFMGISPLREQVKVYNKELEKHLIAVDGEIVRLSYKRIFHDSLEGSGRWYSNNYFQNIKKEYRKHITINNIPCVELDYSSIHPRILYSLEGVPLDSGFKPYDIPDVGRDVAKQTMLIVLNSTSQNKAVFECLNHNLYNSYDKCLKSVVALEQHNIQISKHFYQKYLWRGLQSLDSKIATCVLLTLIDKNIITLPYHDSFVVEQDNGMILQGIMYEAWKKVMGSTMNCVVDWKD